MPLGRLKQDTRDLEPKSHPVSTYDRETTRIRNGNRTCRLNLSADRKRRDIRYSKHRSAGTWLAGTEPNAVSVVRFNAARTVLHALHF